MIISADLHIVGDIEGDGELHVEGRVDGNIRCETLTIGESGQVEGKIVTTSLTLLGMITGTVRARTVRMMEKARMIGDVAHEKIEIRSGAWSTACTSTLSLRISRNAAHVSRM